jgi:hypothetical protein
MQLSGRWAVCRPGHAPVGIDSGDLFLVEVAGKEGLQPKRMEFRQFTGPMKGRTLRGLDGEYCSVDDYHLANGPRGDRGVGGLTTTFIICRVCGIRARELDRDANVPTDRGYCISMFQNTGAGACSMPTRFLRISER